MLPRAYRLRKKQDFDHVFKSGKTIHTAFFRIKIRKNELAHSRIGIIIPNKLIKKAVLRNRKKRQIRAILHSLLLEIPPQYDIVLFALPKITEAEYAALDEDIRSSISRLKT